MLGKIAYVGAFLLFLTGELLLAYVGYARQHHPGCEACGPPRAILNQTSYSRWSFYGGSNSPSPRYMASIAYDASRRNFVLFGGQTATGTSGETWVFDPTGGQYVTPAWREIKPEHSPPARRNASMAWDPHSGLVLMYGGLIPDSAEGTEASDTWAWDGTDWKELTATSEGPGRRMGAGMVTAGDRVLLFGGHIGNVSYFADVWTWNGTGWSRVDRNPTPPGRGDAATVWDPVNKQLFVFGGNLLRPDSGPGNLGLPASDAWALKNGRWSRLPSGPPALLLPYGQMRSDGRIEVDGVSCPASYNEAWDWDGLGWTQGPAGGFGRWGVAVASDTRGNTVIFGGSTEAAC